MSGLFFSLLLIVGGLSGGYLLQVAVDQKRLQLAMPIPSLRKLLQKIGLLGFMPISFLGAVWIVSLDDLRVAFLPAVGLTVLLAGGVLGLLYAKLLKLGRKQMAVMYCCGSFTNIGAIGGLVCFMFLGEAGFALVALYKMFEELSYYTIGFPLARYLSSAPTEKETVLQRLWKVLSDPFVATIFSALVAGLILNFSGVERPLVFEKITSFSVPAGTFVLIFSIGLGMRFSKVTDNLLNCLAISSIKFLCMPAVGCSLAYALGLTAVADGLPFKVVMVLSSMPVAFNALVAASIYDLDLDLANSLWLVTTCMLLLVLPCLYFLLGLM